MHIALHILKYVGVFLAGMVTGTLTWLMLDEWQQERDARGQEARLEWIDAHTHLEPLTPERIHDWHGGEYEVIEDVNPYDRSYQDNVT